MNLFVIFYAVMIVLNFVDEITSYASSDEFSEILNDVAKTSIGRLMIIIAVSVLWPLGTVFSIIENIGNLKR